MQHKYAIFDFENTLSALVVLFKMLDCELVTNV